jgi:formylmethanofuran dehydrogenase subunit A
LTTDHPNGASFIAYPRIIRLLMDRAFQRETMRQANAKALAKTILPDLDREYSLYEIAIITRAGAARLLGLKNKGHLGIGADADITIYDQNDDKEKMFATPRYVIKDGRVLVEDGHIRQDFCGRTFFVTPAYDPAIEVDLRKHFDKYYTIRFENYPVQLEHYLPRHEAVACSREFYL